MTSRVTVFGYDWRDRQVITIDATGRYTRSTLDNLGQATTVAMYLTAPVSPGSPPGRLLTQTDTAFDNRGRAYLTTVWGVDPSTGATTNKLVSNTYFDAAGNIDMSLPAGAKMFTKITYDGLGRAIARYAGYTPAGGSSSSSSSSAGSYSSSSSGGLPNVGPLTNDKIFEQTLITFDEAGNAVATAYYQRFHDAIGLGPLNGPQGPAPAARVSYVASWQDGIGRVIASANYGANGNQPLYRPSLPPASSSSVLVTLAAFNARGEAFESTDPAGMVTHTDFDDAGRIVRTIQNYRPTPACDSDECACCAPCGADNPNAPLCPPPAGNDVNVTVETTYMADGQVATLSAKNPATGDQTTRYQYGTTLATSDIARADLLVAEIYPDATDPTDRIAYSYNRQAQRKSMQDQNGTVHSYDFDALGRQIREAVITLAAGVDGGIRAIVTAFEPRGMVSQVTSCSDAAGVVVANQVTRSYNDFQQLVTEQQVDNVAIPPRSGTVGYLYANGSANTIRRLTTVYPNGRHVDILYNAGDDDALSRPSGLGDASFSPLVAYTYLGLGSFVRADYQQPQP